MYEVNKLKISKKFNVDRDYLLTLQPLWRDGIYRYVDIRNGNTYSYDALNHKFSTGLLCSPINDFRKTTPFSQKRF